MKQAGRPAIGLLLDALDPLAGAIGLRAHERGDGRRGIAADRSRRVRDLVDEKDFGPALSLWAPSWRVRRASGPPWLSEIRAVENASEPFKLCRVSAAKA